jgi:hypothetical protein
VASDANSGPPTALYGDAALSVGHRHPTKPTVNNVPKMPNSDKGANAARDFKLQIGKSVVKATITIHKLREVPNPDKPAAWAKEGKTSPRKIEADKAAPKQKVKLAKETTHADDLLCSFSHNSPKLLACVA